MFMNGTPYIKGSIIPQLISNQPSFISYIHSGYIHSGKLTVINIDPGSHRGWKIAIWMAL